MEDKINNEIPKHIKRKKSSVSKAKEKSKHKHKYIDCLLIKDNIIPYKAAYCKKCGKIGKVKFCETEKTEHGTYRMLNIEEVFAKYKNLPQIYIKDILQKYIPVDVEDNNK